jgi:hypothetical protein
VALMSLRGHLPDTPRGQAIFRLTLTAFLIVIAFAAVALLRREPSIAPDPDAPTTVAGLRRPAAPAGAPVAYVDNQATESHNRRRIKQERPEAA